MSTPMNAQCYLCHFNKNVEKARRLGSEETAAAFAKDLMKMYLTAPEGVSAPWFVPDTEDLLDKYYHQGSDPYKEEKAASNRFVMERLDTIRQRVENAEDPVYAGLQCAILGNYIDFSALPETVSFEKLDGMLSDALHYHVEESTYRQFCHELEQGKNLLYLTDNAGEIGFDRIFAEQIHKKYPNLQITFCVRGGNALNDATREDAIAVGIPFKVIDNGNRVPGTQLDLLGSDAKQAMACADVIIAKGQANTETLWGCGYNIYYAFLVKCERFVNMFQKEPLTPMLIRERNG